MGAIFRRFKESNSLVNVLMNLMTQKCEGMKNCNSRCFKSAKCDGQCAIFVQTMMAFDDYVLIHKSGLSNFMQNDIGNFYDEGRYE